MIKIFKILKPLLSAYIVVITIIINVIAYYLAYFYYPIDLFLMPLYFIMFFFLISTPFWIIIALVLLLKKKNIHWTVRTGISIFIGIMFSFIPAKVIGKQSNDKWMLSGIETQSAIERYHLIHGNYPLNLDEIPDSMFYSRDKTVRRFSNQINYIPDSNRYRLTRNANIFDMYECDTKSKVWIYTDW